MYETINEGDEVEITIRGIVGGYRAGTNSTTPIEVISGTTHFTHYVYLGGGVKKVAIIKPRERFENGKAYADATGRVFLRGFNFWVDADNDVWYDDEEKSIVAMPMRGPLA